MVFRDQILVFARPGLIPAEGLDELLTKVKALDMDDVRKQIKDEEAGQAHDHGHDHSGHDHFTQGAERHHANVSSDESADHHHDASSAHDESSDSAHKCGSCAACHSVGMTPTLDTPLLHGLPQADLAEPLRAMANVSPSVPHKPPRA